MRITLSPYIGHLLLFTIAVILSYDTNFELQFAIWVLLAAYYVLGTYSKQFLIFIACYLIICGLGLYRSLLYDYSFHFIVRDLSYFIKPILGFVIGYQVFKNRKLDALKAIVYISLIIAVGHILILMYHYAFHPLKSIESLRAVGGYFSDFEVYGIIILLFSSKFGLKFTSRNKILLLIVISVSVILYFARTNIIQLVILGLGMWGFYKLNFRNAIILGSVILLGIIGYQAVVEFNPRRNASGIESFLYKIKNAPYEIYDPYVVNDNSARFHDRFRSYETKVTILQVKNNKDASIWLGSGFGSIVNYNATIRTTDGYRIQQAPILHNGYTTVFLKVGLVGLGIFIFSLLYLCFYGSFSKDQKKENVRIFINSTGVFMFLSTLVFLGFYLKLDNKSLIVGALIAYYENLNYRNQKLDLADEHKAFSIESSNS
ncbi:hypothetical protein GO491_07825 [Flavobacteriaceae bacterium Ap0902]|nr:hypothetical protein [Flavobacteriaceae bacterium Ap0902]